MGDINQEHVMDDHQPKESVQLFPEVLLVGTSYKSSPLPLREKLAMSVGGDHSYLALGGVEESSLLSTCNRFEAYMVTRDPESAASSFLSRLGVRAGVGDLGASFYVLRGADAVRHLFRVAAGLESAVVGEPQILSQVRSAGIKSRTSGNAGAILSPLFDRAYRVGARVREAHGLSSGESSLSDLAVEAVSRDQPGRPVVLLLGTGKMIRLAARRLKGAERLYVASKRKTPPSGLEGCTLISHGSLKRVARKCDIVITATSSKKPLLTSRDLAGRRRRVVVDLGMPRNVSESVRRLENVTLIDLDDLAKMAGARKPPKGLRGAETMVADESREFYGWLVQTRLSTALADLYSWAEAVREEELRRTVGKLKPLSDRDLRVIDAMGRRIVSKLLSRPTTFVRSKRGKLSDEEKAELLKSVFRIGDSGGR